MLHLTAGRIAEVQKKIWRIEDSKWLTGYHPEQIKEE